MSTVLWAVGAVAVCAAAIYAAYAIEPHWVAKDGKRFLTTSEVVDRHGTTVGRRREVRGAVLSDGTVTLGTRALMRTRRSMYRVRGKSPQVSRGRQQYVLEEVPRDPMGDLLILRIPTKSALTARFDELATHAESSTEEA
jgi:hypothetical protein